MVKTELVFYNTKPIISKLNAGAAVMYTLNLNSNDKNTVISSLKKINNIEIKSSFHDLFTQADGSIIVTRTQKLENNFKQIHLLQLYKPNFELIGQYRVALPNFAEVADFGYKLQLNGSAKKIEARHRGRNGFDFPDNSHKQSGKEWSSSKHQGNFTYANVSSSNSGSYFSRNTKISSNSENFFKYHNTFEYVKEGNSLFMMTPFALVKLNLNAIVDFKEYTHSSNLLYDIFTRDY